MMEKGMENMNPEKTLCIMGRFDKDADDAFCGLLAQLSKKGFPATDQEPHLTFGIYSGVEQNEFVNWVAHTARNQHKLTLNFNHIGIFQQGICFAEPCANLELLSLHRSLHAKYDQDCTDKDCLYSLKAKSWVPHTTLGVLETEQAKAILPLLFELFRPIRATITKLAVTEYPPLKNICEVPLVK